ncbi:MAG: Wadjet anti-phage system protein JetD domain-containing protein [Poseidonibacter sp.]|uniref:Wadjet anti-phage system protein JetD domain-containing protein n=1 Tax=Poseidonibacter sp. TaxID=2321188 RepID=UPI00359E31A5
MSKIFENHKLLANYLNLNSMPIFLQIHAKSEQINNVLFIENLETFNSCIQSQNKIFDNTVLVYSSGYKASAKRVRQKDGSKLFFTNDCKFSIKSKEDFISWFYEENNLDINTYFWGDFDFEGISILGALKTNFKNLQAWQIAYDEMIKAIKSNFGHTAIMSGKDKQKEPKDTSCFYTDNTLIPLLLEKKLFLDQEFVDIDGL